MYAANIQNWPVQTRFKIQNRLYNCMHFCLTSWKKMKNSSPKNCQPTVGQQSADCRLPLLRKSSASSRPTVGRLRTLVEYQKSLSSQGRTLHIDAKCNFLTFVPHIVLVFLGTNLLAISPGERFEMMLQHIAELYLVH